MSFEELTHKQREYVLELVEYQESGKYDVQMFYLATNANSRLLLRPIQKGEKQIEAASGISRTDLQILHEEGYVTVTQPGNTPLVGLKQKAFREAEAHRANPTGSVASKEALQFGSRVFIGHGRSLVWHQLRDFLEKKLNLQTDEFNRESTAGVTTVERLEQMLGDAGFAFLVMTAEDSGADGSLHARENVVHEAGLFQGRLGFKRAIILLEDDCKVFSNIHGLTYIRFTRNNVSAAFENIRDVLQREGLIT